MSIRYMSRVLEMAMSPVEKIVLIVLADAANDAGICWPGLQLVANRASVSKRTVQRILAELELAGLIRRQPRYREDRSQTSTEYQLFPTDIRGDKLSPPPVPDVTGRVSGEVVGDASAVTLTTTESPVNQNNNHHCGGLIFPSSFSSNSKSSARQLLEGLPNSVSQQLLDEVAGRIALGGVRSSPISYLRSLISSQRAGTFIAELAHRVSDARQKKADRLPVVQVSRPASMETVNEHIEKMKETLGRGNFRE